MKASKWEILRADNGELYARLVAPNGRILASTETFKRRNGALNAIRSIRKNCGAPIIEVHS